MRTASEVAESVFMREPKVGDKQLCLVTQALLHGRVSMPVGQRTSCPLGVWFAEQSGEPAVHPNPRG